MNQEQDIELIGFGFEGTLEDLEREVDVIEQMQEELEKTKSIPEAEYIAEQMEIHADYVLNELQQIRELIQT